MAKHNDKHREGREAQEENEATNRALEAGGATVEPLNPNRNPDAERHNAAVSEVPGTDKPSAEQLHKDATRPWQEPSAVPWQMNMLKAPISQKRKGFVNRWVTEQRIPMREAQGYRVADPKDYGVAADRNNRISRNELILMEIPDEEYEKRRLGIQQFTDAQTRATKAGVRKAARDIERKTGHHVALEDDEDEE